MYELPSGRKVHLAYHGVKEWGISLAQRALALGCSDEYATALAAEYGATFTPKKEEPQTS